MTAKRLHVHPISTSDAAKIVRRLHYSGKVDTRSQISFAVSWMGSVEGAIQLGQPIDKRKALPLVADTPWNGMLDLHRMAFSDKLPRNSESRALAVVIRLLKRHSPHLQWIQSYADATQSGDGAIYRALGFDLISIRPNASMWRMPDGEVRAALVFHESFSPSTVSGAKARYGKRQSESVSTFLQRVGAERLQGHQLRYFLPLQPGVRDRLTVTPLPYTDITKAGARMYRGRALEA